MGSRDQATLRSDSGYGDDAASDTLHAGSDHHPLTLKGYEIGSASKLQVGDVFEFLWADAPEFEWEWKCLGYTRFIVLRRNDAFPHHCACIPISTGPSNKHEFAKPGIDSFQQGYVFANGGPAPGHEQPHGGPRLQYSPIGIELRPGKIRVKEDSRANYADIVDIDDGAKVMVVGDVVKYFDRIRRNVNKAFMRQILRKALEKYQAEKAGKEGVSQPPGQNEGSINVNPVAPESVDGEPGGAECLPVDRESDTLAEPTAEQDPDADTRAQVGSKLEAVPEVPSSGGAEEDDVVPTHKGERRDERPRRYSRHQGERMKQRTRSQSSKSQRDPDYDLMSMHNVAMAGLERECSR
ncbi:hypothetical protein GGR56DRAFT_515494 [Xylariaceae sp. FL0804]|nr:hypothetical protein GGR56DRAFT_515494 [Xylariaceae sp. FL0804]